MDAAGMALFGAWWRCPTWIIDCSLESWIIRDVELFRCNEYEVAGLRNKTIERSQFSEGYLGYNFVELDVWSCQIDLALAPVSCTSNHQKLSHFPVDGFLIIFHIYDKFHACGYVKVVGEPVRSESKWNLHNDSYSATAVDVGAAQQFTIEPVLEWCRKQCLWLLPMLQAQALQVMDTKRRHSVRQTLLNTVTNGSACRTTSPLFLMRKSPRI